MKSLFLCLVVILSSQAAYALTLLAQAPTVKNGHIRLFSEPCESRVFSGHQYIIYDVFENVLDSGCWKSTDASTTITAISKNNVDRMTWNKGNFIKVRQTGKNRTARDMLLK